jgi:hypothetical protein
MHRGLGRSLSRFGATRRVIATATYVRSAFACNRRPRTASTAARSVRYVRLTTTSTTSSSCEHSTTPPANHAGNVLADRPRPRRSPHLTSPRDAGRPGQGAAHGAQPWGSSPASGPRRAPRGSPPACGFPSLVAPLTFPPVDRCLMSFRSCVLSASAGRRGARTSRTCPRRQAPTTTGCDDLDLTYVAIPITMGQAAEWPAGPSCRSGRGDSLHMQQGVLAPCRASLAFRRKHVWTNTGMPALTAGCPTSAKPSSRRRPPPTGGVAALVPSPMSMRRLAGPMRRPCCHGCGRGDPVTRVCSWHASQR